MSTERQSDGQAISISTWPADRITDDHSVSDRIHNAVLAERERCAKIAEHAFDHLSPLAIYESYNADGKRVTRLNPKASSRAIAAKIRIYE